MLNTANTHHASFPNFPSSRVCQLFFYAGRITDVPISNSYESVFLFWESESLFPSERPTRFGTHGYFPFWDTSEMAIVLIWDGCFQNWRIGDNGWRLYFGPTSLVISSLKVQKLHFSRRQESYFVFYGLIYMQVLWTLG